MTWDQKVKKLFVFHTKTEHLTVTRMRWVQASVSKYFKFYGRPSSPPSYCTYINTAVFTEGGNKSSFITQVVEFFGQQTIAVLIKMSCSNWPFPSFCEQLSFEFMLHTARVCKQRRKVKLKGISYLLRIWRFAACHLQLFI